MMIKILTLTGEELEMDVEPSDTVQSLKDKLEEREGIPSIQQRLIFQGKKMKDDQSLKSYKIFPGTTLHLVIALRGGLRFASQERKKPFYRKFVEPGMNYDDSDENNTSDSVNSNEICSP